MQLILLLTGVCILCASITHNAYGEEEAVFPVPIYHSLLEEFQNLDAAFNHLNSAHGGKLVNLQPWVNEYNPSYNGVPSSYSIDKTGCNSRGECYILEHATSINVSMRCPEDVKRVGAGEYRFSKKVIGSGIDRGLICTRTLPKPPIDGPCVGNPISLVSAEKIQIETDYRNSDDVLNFTRTYRSGTGLSSLISNGLMDNSNAQFKSAQCLGSWYTQQHPTVKDIPYCFARAPSGESTYAMTLESGKTLSFSASTSPTNISLSSYDVISKSVSSSGAVEWAVRRQDNSQDFFDSNGNLIRSLLSAGKSKTYTYSDSTTPIDIAPRAGLLIAITDLQGKKLKFTYNAKAQMVKMTDPAGKEFLYAYDDYNNLISVTYPTGFTRQYRFAEPTNINSGAACSGSQERYARLLTGIIDENGTRFADFKYSCDGRAISTEHVGNVEKFQVVYGSDGSVTVTNPLNKQTIYRFANVAGARRVVKVEGQPTTNCVGANQNYTYTPEGWLESKTDWKGNKTFYTYNTKGQEISRTEAYGTTIAKTITTEWHATLNVKTKVTEPDKETVYTYDGNGFLLNQNTKSLL